MNKIKTSIESQKATVLTGSTILANNGFRRLAGSTVGFIGNHTSLLNDSSPTLTSLLLSGCCTVARLFAPEHGAFGSYDDVVPDEWDQATGLTVHSLYGEHRQPLPSMLEGLDFLLFELQDVGARFYTYTATLLLAIDAAADAGIQLIVLDRPNPIGGSQAEGPIADGDKLSFVAPYSIPVRTGLTLGELAILYAKETGKESSVQVEKMKGWERPYYFDNITVPWRPPSPAMTTPQTAMVYPGVCLLEQTNVSVGRGTLTPFEVTGAPYVDGNKWSAQINSQQLLGVTTVPAVFTPFSSKFEKHECRGVRIVITDINKFQPVQFGVLLLSTLSMMYPKEFDIASANALLASSGTLSQIIEGKDCREIAESWSEPLIGWLNRCKPILLY